MAPAGGPVYFRPITSYNMRAVTIKLRIAPMRLRTSAGIVFLVAGIVLCPAVAAGQTAGEMVSFSYGATELHAYVALPAGDGPAPTIIVIHANRGLREVDPEIRTGC